MARQETGIEELRERLTGLLADWGAEMSMLLHELDELRCSRDSEAQRIAALEARLSGQAELFETLKAEAGGADELRSEVRERDLEIERLKSELDSKRDLIRALRRDAEGAERLKAESKVRDQEIAALQRDRRQAEQQLAELNDELDALRANAEDTGEGAAELAAMRAELDARKSLIKSLRADADRVTALENRLEEKREIVATLETSINKHVETIAELKRAADGWKAKYQALHNRSTSATMADVPLLSETDVAILEQLESTDVATPDHTIAIDMRRPLSEARRKVAQSQNKG